MTMPRRHPLAPVPVLDAELWDMPEHIDDIDWLNTLGESRPRSLIGTEEGDHDRD